MAEPGVYNSVSQRRADSWASLEDATRRPAGDGRIEALLAALEPIEHCWVFPGAAGRVRRLHAAGEHASLARDAAELNRALVSGAYRGETAYFEVLVVGELDAAVSRIPDRSPPARSTRATGTAVMPP
jgi:arginine decarboxylase